MKCGWGWAAGKHRWLFCLLAGAFAANSLAAGDSNYILGAAVGTSVDSLAAKYQFSVVKSYNASSGTYYSVSTPLPLSAADAANLSSEPGVFDLEANSTVNGPEADPSSTAATSLQSLGNLLSTRATVQYYGNTVLSTYVHQPGEDIVKMDRAQAMFAPGPAIVATIDTGVDFSHPALSGSLLPGFDFTRNRPDTVSELLDLTAPVAGALQQSTVELLDAKQWVVALQQSTVEILDGGSVAAISQAGLPAAFGHGTMVAGLIHLMAPNAMIMPLKAFNSDGTATIFDIASAIRYAVDNGADVINMSFSFASSSPALQSAVAYATSHNVLCVASVGNAGLDKLMYPAAYPHVVGVASTNFSDQRSSFSNFGDYVDAAAPGEALVTLYPGGNYAAVWGTSFSSAMVAGSAGFMYGVDPTMSFCDFQGSLNAGAPMSAVLEIGHARLDLLQALITLTRPVH